MIQKELSRLYYKFNNRLNINRFHRLALNHPCLLCDNMSTQRLCKPCTEQFFFCPSYRCTRCGIPLEHNALFCGECLRQAPDFDQTFSPYLYQTPLSDLIIQFKQKRDFVAGKALSELFAKAIRHHYRQQHLPLPDLIAPVPQHWKSQWQRSFNHAIIFSHEISQQLSIPIFKALKRVRATPPQKALDKKARLANLQQSFHITDSLNGEHIAIVDDVMTTGATANTLAQALKAAGAGKVTIWVLARTPKPNNKTR